MRGDPWVRVVDVYVPAGHDGEGLPLLVDLVGLTGSGLSHTNWVGFRENLPERLDRLIAEQRMPPLVVAFPDYFTHLGGKSIHQLISRGRLGRLWHELPAGTVPLRTLCAAPTSGRPRPVIPAIWASSCAICPTCRRFYAHALAGAENPIKRWWQQLEAAKKHPPKVPSR
jgi:hypothetical protein